MITIRRKEGESEQSYRERLELAVRLQKGLPFKFGKKLYKWQRKFLDSRNKKCFVTAANQIGKSVINITKCIDWATNKKIWKDLWPHYDIDANRQFWYFYPDYKMATTEFHEKWVPELLPNKDFLTEQEWNLYGWEADFDRKEIRSIRFHTGASVYFKAYSQKASALQAGTVFAMFCDEEMPEELYDELKFRLSASEGYFNMVFTATLGQEFWRQVMEEKNQFERFPDSFKQQISLYDCMFFEDGSASAWTDKRIAARIADCSSDKEVQRRIYGKFVKSEGLKYPSFDYSTNMINPHDQERDDWIVFAGLDYGSGGKDGHPSAITFVRTNKDYTKAEVFIGWRGDGIQTTAADVIRKYYELIEQNNLKGRIGATWYDYHCRDFKTISDRLGEDFQPANKKHDEGEYILNSLFKHKALDIIKDNETEKLAYELQTLTKDIDKRKARDDFADALRYTVTSIPWNWDDIKITKPQEKKKELNEIDLRRQMFDDNKKEYQDIQDTINFWNGLMED